MCDSGVYSREIISMYLVGQVSLLVENFNRWTLSVTLNVMNVILCVIVLLIELYLFIPFV